MRNSPLRGARRRFGSDDAAGARLGFDDDGRAVAVGDVLREYAGQQVDAAARRHRNDDADRSCGLRPCRTVHHSARQARQCERAGRKAEKLSHGRLPERLRAAIAGP